MLELLVIVRLIQKFEMRPAPLGKHDPRWVHKRKPSETTRNDSSEAPVRFGSYPGSEVVAIRPKRPVSEGPNMSGLFRISVQGVQGVETCRVQMPFGP